MNAYWKLTQAGIKAFTRDRFGLFWSFFLPVMFIFLFGMISSKSGSDQPEFKIGLVMPDTSQSAAVIPTVLRQIPVFEIHQGSLDAETAALLAGKCSAVIVFPPDLGAKLAAHQTSTVRVLYSPTQQQTGPVIVSVISQVIGGIDKNLSGAPTLLQAVPEQVVSKELQAKKPSTLDFLLPGILAMTIMQLGLFTAIPLINMREKGILKRLRATPLPRSAFVGSQVTTRLVIGVLQTVLLVGLGAALYKFHVACSWFALLGLVVLGILTFVALGAVLASFAKSQESGAPLVQFVQLPMLFLSGIFFPADFLPHSIKPIMNILPSTYLADALRHLMLAIPSAYTFGTDLAAMGVWLVGSLLIAARFFRWE